MRREWWRLWWWNRLGMCMVVVWLVCWVVLLLMLCWWWLCLVNFCWVLVIICRIWRCLIILVSNCCVWGGVFCVRCCEIEGKELIVVVDIKWFWNVLFWNWVIVRRWECWIIVVIKWMVIEFVIGWWLLVFW